MPMYGAKIKVETKKQSIVMSTPPHVISIQCSVTSQRVDLIFNPNIDQSSFLEWSKCIKESKKILASQINRLSHVQFTLLSHSTVDNCKKESLSRVKSQPRRKPKSLGKYCSISF